MGVCVPEEYGGAGADFLSYILVLEQLSRADAGVGVTVAVHTSATTLPILAWGTDEQKSRFVPPLARGETIGAFALSEPDVGSDASRLRCAATRDGDEWVISGQKQWITNASTRTRCSSSRARIPRRPGARGISAFLLGAEHVQVTREEEKLGLNSSSTGDLVLDQARVGADRMLGAEGEGFAVAMSTLDGGRIGIAAQALGIAQAAYDVAREYALQRHTFGQPIARHQAIQWKLVDMAVEIEAARLLTYQAAWLKENGLPYAAAGAKAKLAASETARRQTAEAIQVLGGYGYTKEFPVERYYRDAKVTEIYEGTSEIQRLVIARDILKASLMPRKPDEPVRLTKIYTRGGDEGQTSLGDGTRVSKLDPRVVADGDVDELNSLVGWAAVVAEGEIAEVLARVENELFDLGADITVPEGEAGLRVTQEQIDRLEADCDRFNEPLPELKSFVLPGGTELAARLFVARAVCRRAERSAIAAGASPLVCVYLNRLSDLLFILARAANAAAGHAETLWKPGK